MADTYSKVAGQLILVRIQEFLHCRLLLGRLLPPIGQINLAWEFRLKFCEVGQQSERQQGFSIIGMDPINCLDHLSCKHSRLTYGYTDRSRLQPEVLSAQVQLWDIWGLSVIVELLCASFLGRVVDVPVLKSKQTFPTSPSRGCWPSPSPSLQVVW